MNSGINFKEILEATVGLLEVFWWLIPLLIFYWLIGKIKPGKKNGGKPKKKISGKPDFSRYILNKSVLTPNEQDFYRCLKFVTNDKFVILSKIRVADIFKVKGGKGFYQEFNRIKAKHIDFLICSPRTFKPLLAIEVDDKSHDRPSRKKRDDFINALFESSELPILRYKAKKQYLVEEVRAQVVELVNGHFFEDED